MGDHEKDQGKDGEGQWPKSVPPPPKPDPGKHEKK